MSGSGEESGRRHPDSMGPVMDRATDFAVVVGALLVAALAVASCDGAGEPAGPEIEPVAIVEVSPQTGSLEIGETLRLAAVAKSANGASLGGRVIVWASSDTAVAAVSGQGQVLAKAAGEATVSATSEGRSGVARVSVRAPVPPQPTIASIAPAAVPAASGSFTLTVTGSGFVEGSGVFINGSGRPTSHVSATELRALVTTEDVRLSGTAQVRVWNPVGHASNPAVLSIERAVVGVRIAPFERHLWPAETVHLEAVALDDRGAVWAGVPVTWSSGHPGIATIDSAGRVRANATGQAVITASAAGRSTSAVIDVITPPAFDLLFEGLHEGRLELFVLTPGSGDPPRRLLPFSMVAMDPAVSPDGERIAFVGRDQDGNHDIYTVHRDGSGLRRLTTSPEIDDEPAWSLDGTRIAFRSLRSGFSDVWLMDADGGRQTNLTWTNFRIGNPAARHPAWSPDGRIAFAFVDLSLMPSTSRILTMRPDGTDWRVLVSRPGYTDTEPAFSAATQLLAFRRGQASQAGQGDQVTLAMLDGTDLILPFQPGPGFAPAWSPDGRWLAFHTGGGVAAQVILTRPGELLRKAALPSPWWGEARNAAWLPRR